MYIAKIQENDYTRRAKCDALFVHIVQEPRHWWTCLCTFPKSSSWPSQKPQLRFPREALIARLNGLFTGWSPMQMKSTRHSRKESSDFDSSKLNSTQTPEDQLWWDFACTFSPAWSTCLSYDSCAVFYTVTIFVHFIWYDRFITVILANKTFATSVKGF